MDVLILFGRTGGGHGGASVALKEEMERRGHRVVMMDPYELINDRLGRRIGNIYISLVRNVPWLFSFIYFLGELYRKLPIHSPVYALNRGVVKPMEEYLTEHHFDVILIPHMFPAMILTAVKETGFPVPPMIYIATDYVCVPFTEEAKCDYNVIPSPRLMDDFISKGLDPATLLPLGIPVRAEFLRDADRDELLTELGLSPDKRYILLAGGSMGAGKLFPAVKKIYKYLKKHRDHVLIVVCGTNERLYRKLTRRYSDTDRIIRLQVTNHMGDYMKVSDVFVSKPGGLSCTEAAVSRVPIIHVAPIRGCETDNMKFFSVLGLSIDIGNHRGKIGSGLDLLSTPSYAEQMIRLQEEEINPHAAEAVCDFAEGLM